MAVLTSSWCDVLQDSGSMSSKQLTVSTRQIGDRSLCLPVVGVMFYRTVAVCRQSS